MSSSVNLVNTPLTKEELDNIINTKYKYTLITDQTQPLLYKYTIDNGTYHEINEDNTITFDTYGIKYTPDMKTAYVTNKIGNVQLEFKPCEHNVKYTIDNNLFNSDISNGVLNTNVDTNLINSNIDFNNTHDQQFTTLEKINKTHLNELYKQLNTIVYNNSLMANDVYNCLYNMNGGYVYWKADYTKIRDSVIQKAYNIKLDSKLSTIYNNIVDNQDLSSDINDIETIYTTIFKPAFGTALDSLDFKYFDFYMTYEMSSGSKIKLTANGIYSFDSVTLTNTSNPSTINSTKSYKIDNIRLNGNYNIMDITIYIDKYVYTISHSFDDEWTIPNEVDNEYVNITVTNQPNNIFVIIVDKRTLFRYYFYIDKTEISITCSIDKIGSNFIGPDPEGVFKNNMNYNGSIFYQLDKINFTDFKPFDENALPDGIGLYDVGNCNVGGGALYIENKPYDSYNNFIETLNMPFFPRVKFDKNRI